jgi:hypothetical protein
MSLTSLLSTDIGVDRRRFDEVHSTPKICKPGPHRVSYPHPYPLSVTFHTSGNFNPSWKNGISLFTLFQLDLCLDRLNSSNQVKSRKILLDQGDPFP